VARSGIVRVGEIAAFWNITPRRVQQLVAEEKMPTEGRGQYDLLKCTAWYIRFLQRLVEVRSPNPAVNGTGTDVETATAHARERLAVTKAERELKEMDLAKRRGEVVEVEAAASMWADAVEKMRARMLASVNGASVRCVGLTTRSAAQAVLQDVVHGALAEVAAIGDEVEERAN